MRNADAVFFAATLTLVAGACNSNQTPGATGGTGATTSTAGQTSTTPPAAGLSGGQITPAAGSGVATPVAGSTSTGAAGSSTAGSSAAGSPAAGSGDAPTTGAAGSSAAGSSAVAGSGDAPTTGAAGSGAAGSGAAGSGAAGGPAAGSDAPVGSGDTEFDACYAMVKQTCVAKEMNTAELMEQACKELTNIPIPLSAGGMYGPVTVKGGPYAGKTEWNEGKGTPFVNEVNSAEPVCIPFGIESFMEPAEVNAEILNLRDVDYSLYTIFRPACFKKGETYPVITWANGTCGEIAGYSSLLSMVASYGYVVIASNSTWTATSPTDKVQLRALDYAKALNEDPMSLFYQKLDLERVGAMGHSQGAMATANADDDPRIKSVIFWNTGTSNVKPFLNVSGERDVVSTTPESMKSGADQATQPGAWLYFHKVPETGGSSTGHLTLMMQPDRVIDLTVAWWDWQLKGNEEAKKMFIGDDCGLCKTPAEFSYGHNALLK